MVDTSTAQRTFQLLIELCVVLNQSSKARKVNVAFLQNNIQHSLPSTFDASSKRVEQVTKYRQKASMFAHLKPEVPLGILNSTSYQARGKADYKRPTVGLFGMRTQQEGTQDIIGQQWRTTVAITENRDSVYSIKSNVNSFWWWCCKLKIN